MSEEPSNIIQSSNGPLTNNIQQHSTTTKALCPTAEDAFGFNAARGPNQRLRLSIFDACRQFRPRCEAEAFENASFRNPFVAMSSPAALQSHQRPRNALLPSVHRPTWQTLPVMTFQQFASMVAVNAISL